jgi:hypothetical protein
MEARWLVFDRLVRDLGALQARNASVGAESVPEARMTLEDAAQAISRIARFRAGDFNDRLFVEAAAALVRAQRAAGAAQSVGAGPRGTRPATARPPRD